VATSNNWWQLAAVPGACDGTIVGTFLEPLGTTVGTSRGRNFWLKGSTPA